VSELPTPAEPPENEGEQPSPKAVVQIWTTQDDPQEEPEPTEGASLDIKLENLGEVGMQVPAENAGQLISISPLMLGMLCSIAGPIVLLETAPDLDMPWGAWLAMAIVLAIIPIVYVLFRSQRDEA